MWRLSWDDRHCRLRQSLLQVESALDPDRESQYYSLEMFRGKTFCARPEKGSSDNARTRRLRM